MPAEENKKKCFIIMPISTPKGMIESYGGDADHFEHVMNSLFVPAIEKAGMKAILPNAEGSDLIPARIIQELQSADLVLCDISTHNPNVFFELGVRTALNKPACYVKDDLTKKIPFDNNALNHYTYGSSLAGWLIQQEIEDLSTHISASVVSSKGSNSLWKYFGLTTTGQPITGTTEERQDLIMKELMSMGARLDRLTYVPDHAVPYGNYSNELRTDLMDTFLSLKKEIEEKNQLLKDGANEVNHVEILRLKQKLDSVKSHLDNAYGITYLEDRNIFLRKGRE